MVNPIEEEVVTPVEVSNNGGGGISFVDLIKQDLQELADTTDVYIPVAGYETSGLAINYRLAESGEINRINQKVEKEFPKKDDEWKRNINSATDTMIALCLGIYVKPATVDDYVMLDDDRNPGVPMQFDHRFAKIVGVDENSNARTVVRKMFTNGGEVNELMLLGHAEKLGRWLANTRADLEKELWQLGG